MLNNIIIFVLSAFVGTEVLSKVPQTLHTPLMSGANAISGITIVGALVATGMAGTDGGVWVPWIGFAALVVATINVVGGFLVTDRMLQMFAKKEPKAVEGGADRAAVASTDGRAGSRAGAKKATPFK
jgi:NAD(P) transhydrogenase subunit alpha